ncbi:hypothetical protein CRUP_008252 [Coryphaenoides rupestris]|nr:hypothetical protein CRUP_008252 [Coryphaenoides rupestris]
MESGAYGASLAGGSFDVVKFMKQPQTVARCFSWIFSIVVFATITSEGQINTKKAPDTKCMFNNDDSACSYAMAVGVLAFLACMVFIALDAYLPQLSNAKERKYIVTGDLAFSGAWAFLWFVCFCVLSHQWAITTDTTGVAMDAARAAIAFSFFSIISWAILAYLAYRRYTQGVDAFEQEYRDPATDPSAFPPTYPPYPSSGPEGYQQSPFNGSQEPPGDYQPPTY